jgi:hypothetical protein
MASIKLAIGFTALALTGCGSSLKIDTEFDREASFTNLRTYDWVSEGDKRSAPNPQSERRIVAAVERELEAKGYQKDSSDPDFLVGFVVVVVDEVVQQTAVTDSVLGYVSMRSSSQTFSDGTMVLFVEDSGRGRVIWRGVAEKSFNRDASRDEVDKTIDEAVKKMLAEFPPEE